MMILLGPKWTKPYLDSLHQVLSVHESYSYAKARSDPIRAQAMQDELDALDNNEIWKLTSLPPEKHTTG